MPEPFFTPLKPRTPGELARLIDHTLLRPDATQSDIARLCDEALQWDFLTVCVNPCWIAFCAERLKRGPTQPIAVVGFPLGAATTESKVFETRQAVELGAKEIDMVLNVGRLKSDDHEGVLKDVRAVVAAAGQVPVKVILETSLLTDNEKRSACLLVREAGGAFVKTSTGFGKGGATADDIRLMREAVGPDLGVKASGGVKTLDQVLALLKAGASRIGSSASVAIVQEAAAKW